MSSVFAGSAHTILGSYWSKKLGKKKLLGNNILIYIEFNQSFDKKQNMMV